jgi:undecaprenyl phosphate-alpha-L-ara4N flippase subunit ArnE
MYYVISFALMIGFTVAANVFLKAGAMVPAPERTIAGVCDWRTLLGFVFFGTAAVVYSGVLQWLPLNVAQSIAASQFVAVIVASALILAEPIPLVRLLGIVLIMAGIVVVSLSNKALPTPEPATPASAEHEPR